MGAFDSRSSEGERYCPGRGVRIPVVVFLLVCVVGFSSAKGRPSAGRRAGEVLVEFAGAPPVMSEALGASASVDGRGKQLRTYEAREDRPGIAGLDRVAKRYGLLGVEPLVGNPERATRERGVKGQVDLGSLRSHSRVHRLVFPPETDLDAVIGELRRLPGITLAEPNWIGSLAYSPSDALYPQQSVDFGIIQMEGAWQAQIDGGGAAGAVPSVVVAVIDSGVETVHPDLVGVLDLANAYNFVDSNTVLFDDIGHGTRVAGIVGAASGSDGIAGVAFGCTVLPLDVTNPDGVITTADVVSAVNYAVAQGAAVVNMSLTFEARSALLESTCGAAEEAGVLLVAAAGNQNQGDAPVYPASFDSVIGVGAVMDDGVTRASFSNFNASQTDLVELVAPGTTVFSSIPGGQYNGTYGSGTSYASPMVAAVAALLMTENPGQSSGAVRAHLRKTAAPVTGAFLPAGGAGYGLLDAQAALETPMVPVVSIVSVSVDDAPGYDVDNDGDGALDVGESARLIVTLEAEDADATGLVATLSTTDADIGAIVNNSATYGAVRVSQPTANDADPFSTVTVSATAGVKDVTFDLALSGDEGYAESLSFALPIEDEIDIAGVKISYPFSASETYHVTGNLFLFDPTTIPAGTVIKVDPGVDVRVDSNCDLTAVGTEEDPIVFTSAKPIAGGDIGLEMPVVGPRTEPVNLGSYDQVRYVDVQGGSDTTGDGSSGNPWASITYALTQISGPSVSNYYAILVAEGTYAETTIAMRNYIDLFGGFEATAWTRDIYEHPTILDGENARGIVVGTWNCVFDGFVLTRGYASKGGGVYVSDCELTITNNFFIANEAWFTGGGLHIDGQVGAEQLLVEHNLFFGNRADEGVGDRGGAISSWRDNSIFSHNVFIANRDNWGAAGLAAEEHYNRYSVNNYYIGNAGDGIRTSGDSSPIIANDVYYDNQGVGVRVGSAVSTSITNTIFLENADGTTQVSGGAASVNYCNIQGGYPGTGNIDEDPLFVGTIAGGVATSLEYDPVAVQTLLEDPHAMLLENSLRGQVVRLGNSYYFAASNTETHVLVWGDATQGDTINVPQPWTALDFHLQPGSLCIGAGVGPTDPTYGASVPLEDIDGDTRSGSTCDIGPDEYNVSTAPQSPFWGSLWVTPSAVGADFEHVIVENGQGLLNELAATTISRSRFQGNLDYGLKSTAGTSAITYTTATLNIGPGLSVGSRPLADCTALYNGAKGLETTGALTDAHAYGNGGDALTGNTASDCTAEFNAGDGAVLTGTALRVTAKDNRRRGIVTSGGDVTEGVAQYNDGTGIQISGGGTLAGSVASYNGGGGILTDGSTVDGCFVEGNTGVGVTGSGTSTVSDTRIIGSTGAAVSGVTTVLGCAVAENGGGIGGATTVTGAYVANNTGAGITGGAISNSSVVGNAGDGINTLVSLNNTWVVNNAGYGVYSDAGTGTITNAGIQDNANGGVYEIASMSGSNIYDNGTYEASDQDSVGSGFRILEDNYWGPAHTAVLDAGIPFDNMTFLLDAQDPTGGTYILDVWPYALAQIADSPTSAPPTFLMSVTPTIANPVNVGITTFTLTFSGPMNTAIDPSVTFGQSTPYITYVVEPAPGWVDAHAWTGTFAVSIETGDGLHTIRASGAFDVKDFLIPDDTSHVFLIDTSGGGAANNGLASAIGTTEMQLTWTEIDRPPTAQGYNIRRSPTGVPGSYERINGSPLTAAAYLDSGLDSGTTYFYVVDIVDSESHATEWTPPFYGLTGGSATPTPTTTPPPTLTPTPTQTPTPTPTDTPVPTGTPTAVDSWWLF